jgi:DUF4097 and DUF4098 domain-containing protein YvlB
MNYVSTAKTLNLGTVLILGLFFPVSAYARARTDTTVFPASEIREFDVQLASEDFEILSGNVTDIEVEIVTNRTKGIPSVVQSGNTLKISNERYFELFYKRCLVRVTVPENFCADGLTLSSSSGYISVHTIKSVQADFTASSGAVKCESLSIQKELAVKTTSGSIGISKLQVQELSCSSSSGRIYADGLVCMSAAFKSLSGSIEAGEMTAGLLKIKTTSGRVSCMLKKLPEQESYAESTSGNISLNLPENDGFSVSADTMSGMYRNEFTGVHQGHIDPSLRDVYKSGTVKFVLKATSGSITIKKYN